ncbi:pyridoxal phosphate-dependent aminotransferase [Maridesulfovibrio zosterae]|uniref:pyridoxal phosphate-dependent aminotransferase n=1 Tax=Maridesulfovibrio zosterae TaxID=82171 RepID=UPI00041FEF8B|nr:pyridoxal phosphate-dependent aminotransferase [Maridesulfovibrio zosterae]
MQLVSDEMSSYVGKSSWIRKMFEAGIVLKKKYGEDAVCDFSLGNPDLAPPPAVKETLLKIAENADKPFALGYMPNFGYPDVRDTLARKVTEEQEVEVAGSDIIVTCGAAGALNIFFRAILNPGDEVICSKPVFVDYSAYVGSHGGILKPVSCNESDFSLDLDAIEAGITDKTCAVLLNSPNNPTGVIYSAKQLKELGELLTRKSEGRKRPILLVSDEPYRFLAFDGEKVPSMLQAYTYSVACSSFSKNLALAGERVGYAVVNPAMEGKEQLINVMTMANRFLGFINAPCIGQRLMQGAIDSQVDISIYDERRKAMAEVLDEAGYEYPMPKGAFYFFVKAPGGDDVAFCQRLMEEKILAVPGTGFQYPGYFRLSFCVDTAIIRRAAPGLKKAMEG